MRPQPHPLSLVIDEQRWKDEAEAVRLVRRAAEAALVAKRASGAATIRLTSEAAMRNLNATFRGRKAPTNVLSFPSEEPGYLGDIAVAFGVVAKEARAQKKPFAHHAAHLAVHGVLHLLGHDHMKPREAVGMEALEKRILAGLGIADPYVLGRAA
jgi:probable rRNA maturation factor